MTNTKRTAPITLSTVTPVYCGAKYLERLTAKLAALRTKWIEQNAPIQLVESIFVNDGSIDESGLVLKKLQEQYDWITVITLSRNYGQHSATVAGICHTATDWVATLDEDLQHKPELIESLLACQIENGADVVYARSIEAVHGRSWRDKSSRWVKSIVAFLASTPQIKLFNSFRLVRGNIARAAASSSSSNTYFDVALSWFTRSCYAIDVELRDERFQQQKLSGYSLIGLIKHARRLIVSSELDVSALGLLFGFSAVMFSIGLTMLTIIQKLFFPELVASTGWASTISVISFLGGTTIALLCVALEYLNIIVLNNLGRPTFFTINRSQDHRLQGWLK